MREADFNALFPHAFSLVDPHPEFTMLGKWWTILEISKLPIKDRTPEDEASIFVTAIENKDRLWPI
jgi:hypothetical protein